MRYLKMEKTNKKAILAFVLGLVISFAFTIVAPSFIADLSAEKKDDK
jgi:hypothetical protein